LTVPIAVVGVIAINIGISVYRKVTGYEPPPTPVFEWPTPAPIPTPTPFPSTDAARAWQDGYDEGYEDGYDSGTYEPGTYEEPVYPYDDWP